MDELVDRAQSSLEPSRDIYIYGETDQETNLQLRLRRLD